MFRIRRFGVVKTANVIASLYVVLIAIFVPFGMAFVAVAPKSGAFGNLGVVEVLFFGLLLAVFYGILGWITTAVACLLYNFAAGFLGGIEVQVESVQPPQPAAGWGGAAQSSVTPTAPPRDSPPNT